MKRTCTWAAMLLSVMGAAGCSNRGSSSSSASPVLTGADVAGQLAQSIQEQLGSADRKGVSAAGQDCPDLPNPTPTILRSSAPLHFACTVKIDGSSGSLVTGGTYTYDVTMRRDACFHAEDNPLEEQTYGAASTYGFDHPTKVDGCAKFGG